MSKTTKNFLSLILTVITVFSMSINIFAVSPSEASAKIEKDYRTALSLAGYSSFHGHCNVATAYQLLAKGIYVGDVDYCGNGYDWYKDYTGETKTSGGYNVITIGGANCLYELVKKYGNNLSNIVVSFGTGGSSGNNHVMLISNIINGDVYFTDSFRYWLDGEGETRVLTISEFMDQYNDMNGRPYGCVYFSKTEKSTNLKASSSSNKNEFKVGSYEIVVDDLSFRKAATTASSVIDYLYKNTYVYVSEVKDNWGKIVYDGLTGWICLYNNKTYAKLVSENDVTHKVEIKDLTVTKNEKTNEIVAECTATGGWNTLKYKFSVYKNGDVVKETEFTSDEKYTCKVTEDGTYSIKVTVKDAKDNTVTKTSLFIYFFKDPSVIVKGSVLGNERINSKDARAILRYCAKLGQIDGSKLCNADVNSDGKISSDDARLILKMAAHLT